MANSLRDLMHELVVFSGSAHRPLAEDICANLGVHLSPVELTRFSNDCLQAQLQANCRQRDVYIVQPLVPPTQEHLMELLLMIDAARGASASSVTAVIPHYSYARSDKKDASRISIGGRLVADLLATAGVDRVITMTLHAPQVHGFFSVPVDQLTALGILAEHFYGQDLSDCVVVSPDLGNAKTATQFSRLLGLPVAAGSKQRLADDRVLYSVHMYEPYEATSAPKDVPNEQLATYRKDTPPWNRRVIAIRSRSGQLVRRPSPTLSPSRFTSVGRRPPGAPTIAFRSHRRQLARRPSATCRSRRSRARTRCCARCLPYPGSRG